MTQHKTVAMFLPFGLLGIPVKKKEELYRIFVKHSNIR